FDLARLEAQRAGGFLGTAAGRREHDHRHDEGEQWKPHGKASGGEWVGTSSSVIRPVLRAHKGQPRATPPPKPPRGRPSGAESGGHLAKFKTAVGQVTLSTQPHEKE